MNDGVDEVAEGVLAGFGFGDEVFDFGAVGEGHFTAGGEGEESFGDATGNTILVGEEDFLEVSEVVEGGA